MLSKSQLFTRQQVMQQFFVYLQNTFGGLRPLLDPYTPQKPAIITRSDGEIHTDDLKQLMSHECSAIHIRNFYDPATSMEIGKKLTNDAITNGMARNWKVSTSRGLESSDVSTLGSHSPFNVISGMTNQAGRHDKNNNNEDSNHILNEYFKGVKKELRDRRLQITCDNKEQPQLWPLDKLRLELDEAWPGGAGLAREQKGLQRPFSGGLPRVMVGPTRWKKGFIHVDEMAPLSATNGLFSANIYLQQPNQVSSQSGIVEGKIKSNDEKKTCGGDLHIWPLGVRSRWDWYKVGCD